MKLCKEQEELESKLKLRVIGLSLFDTVMQVYTSCTFVFVHLVMLYNYISMFSSLYVHLQIMYIF